VTDFAGLLQALSRGCVNFIVAGGAAATAHGSARLTIDIDVVYDRSAENIQRLVKALTPLRPYLRDAPAGLPFSFDEATVQRGLNFTLMTTLGPLDLFGELTGGGTYDKLLPDSTAIDLFGMTCRCLSLDQLIAVKRATGRPKDLEALAELEAIREERERR
jgi:hypothetical protein